VPRRHRSARDRAGSPPPVERPLTTAPDWASADGAVVRAVAGQKDKTYRCPGCDLEVRPGTPHLVVVEHDDVAARRHWHTHCWRVELRRRGYPV
jgi:hypothetical protein